MSGRRIHYAVEVFYDTLFQPACENARGRDAIADVGRECEMTTDESEVTCPACLKALGYAVEEAAAPVELRRAA